MLPSAANSQMIFVVGTPGSRWSSVARAVAYADGVNHSDESGARTYRGPGTSSAVAPAHFGNYFGPGMEFGDDFADIESLPADVLAKELGRPYTVPGGVRLVKCHYFARSLPHLAATFPAARFLLVHREDEQCLDWWLRCGGFDIPYPRYDHYGDVAGMRKAISADNAAILAFATERGATFRADGTLAAVTRRLDLSLTDSSMAARAANPLERSWVDGLPGTTLREKLDTVLTTAGVACL